MAFNDGRAECGFVSVDLVVFTYVYIREVARRLRPTVYGVVLRGRNGQVVLWIVALQSGHISDTHAAGEEGIFAVGLLTATPARIAEDVQIGGPEIESSHDPGVSFARILHMLDAPLNADLGRHGVNARRIECGSKANGLGILGDTLIDHSVKGL